MNLNANQVIAIIITILGVLAVSAANLTDLFGPAVAKYIVSASVLLSTIMAGVLSVITGPASQIKAVAAMPGMEPLRVNSLANTTLAQLAVDPAQPRIGATPEAKATVEATAAAA